jgi:hypothetical protein
VDLSAGGVLAPKSPATVAAGSGRSVGVAVSPDGASVYVANSDDNNVYQYDVGAGGLLTPKSPASVAGGTVPEFMAVSPEGGSVYVANGGSNDVSQYDVGAGGALTPKSPATVAAGAGAGDVAVSPLPYPIPRTATPLQVPLVQVFRQCGGGGNPVDASHAPPPAVGACNPPISQSGARVGPTGSGSVRMTVMPADVQIEVLDSDIRTPTGTDYNPAGTADLKEVARFRLTDTNNCTPNGCTGPYAESGTATELDFGPVPVTCVPKGSSTTSPGSDCNVTMTANGVVPGFVVAGKLASIQVFRLRVNDSANTLFQQQGILVR